ncbi:MAG: glycosyltransferase family 2 protein [Nitrospirota bacterium]
MDCAEPCKPMENRNIPQLSVVLPVYQEYDVIRRVIMQLVKTLEQAELSFEIIVVDDGSTDGTREILHDLASSNPKHIHIICHPYNKGNGAAIKTGINAVRGEMIFCMDADGQHDPQNIFHMLPYMSEYDLIVGARTMNYQGKWYRNLANKFYNSLSSWLTKFPIKDLTSGCRLFRASIVKQYVHLFPARFSYPTTSTLAFIKGGHNVKYVPIEVHQRKGNRSKIKPLRDGWRFLIIILKIIVIFEPLRVFLPAAFVLFLLGCFSSTYSMLHLGRLHIPNSGVLLFISSVLIFLLGLISEQIAALHISQSKGNT